MKISVDDVELFTLSDIQKNVIQNDITTEEFDADMKRRLQYVLVHKYERCFERMKKEWEPKLIENGVTMIPTDKNAFAQLVFSQTNYQNRSQREELENE